MAKPAGRPTGRIFISYRRDDTAYPAGWLYDRLAERFGRDQVFKDIDSIELGDDFVDVLNQAVGSCQVLLALIGGQWLTVTDDQGRRRLDDPKDFVRLEIEAALTRDVRVIPVLIDGARMPRADELPAGLDGLERRQALELSPNRFDADTAELMDALDTNLVEIKEEERLRSSEKKEDPPSPLEGRGWLVAVVAAVAVAVLVVVAVALVRSSGGGQPAASPSAPSSPSAAVQREWRTMNAPGMPELVFPAVAAHQGSLWVVGGSQARTDDVYLLDPATGEWRSGPKLPAPISHAALVSDGQKLYLIGGLRGSTPLATVWILDSPTGSWRAGPALPKPRLSGAAAWDGSRIVFAGGSANQGKPHRNANDDVWALKGEGDAWTTVGRLSKPSEHLAAATDGHGTVWFAGGADPAKLKVYGGTNIVRDGTVAPGPQLAVPVSGAGAVWTTEAGLCVLGGSPDLPTTDDRRPITAVQCPQPPPGAPKWPDLPVAGYGLGAALLDGKVFASAGPLNTAYLDLAS